MFSFILSCVGILVIFYVGTIYENPAICMIGYAGVIFMLVSYGIILYRIRNLEVKIHMPITLAEEGQRVHAHMQIGYHGFFPPSKFQYIVSVKGTGQRVGRRKWLRGEQDFKATFLQSGTYQISLKWVKVYDLLGILYLLKPVKSHATVEILPCLHTVPLIITQRVRMFYGDSEQYDDFMGGQDVSEMFQIREFQNGDKIQSVHWKLSAKADELMVKEHGLPKACPVALFLQIDEGRKKRRNLHAYLEIIASISFSMMQQGCPHYMVWYSGSREELVRARVSDEESFYLFLTYLFADELGKKVDLISLYDDKFRYENLLHRIQIDLNLDIYQNELLIKTIRKGKVEQDVSELEMIL